MDVVDGLTNPNLYGVVKYNLLLWFRCRFKNQIAIHLSRKKGTSNPNQSKILLLLVVFGGFVIYQMYRKNNRMTT